MKRTLLLICTLLCANVLMAQTRFWVGNLQYEVTSTNPSEVEVHDADTSTTNANIPTSVTYGGTTYSVTSIGSLAFSFAIDQSTVFEYNNNLTSVIIPNSVTIIGEAAFVGCNSLTSIDIPNSVISIGNSAFENCESLTSVNIPNSVAYIGENAFSSCSSLTSSITIPNSVTSIGDGVFYGCSSLTSVNIPNSVSSIGNFAFENCESLTSVNIPNSVAYIGENAFSSCSSLTSSITIPNSVTSIGDGVFYGCSSLTSVNIPNSVSSIGNFAFYGCSSLTSVNIPNSVTSIGNFAFRGCSSLTSVTCLATNPPILEGNYVFDRPNNATLTVPCGSLEAYSSSTSWDEFFNSRIEEDCSGLEKAESTELSVYPNPTSCKLTFDNAVERIDVIDISGKTIQTYENASEINIESLPAGVYHLRLTNNEKAITRKIIKK